MTLNARSAALVAVMVGCTAGCGATGQDEITVPLTSSGVTAAPFDARGGWTVTLDEALVGMGPIYFCAAMGSSGDLCPTSVAELTDSFTIDALDPEPQPAGELDALTVEAHSAAWDFAITWPTTETTAVVLDGAPGWHSAHFSGNATREGTTVRFVADVDVVPLLRATHAVQGVRTDADIVAGTTCEVHADPTAWWSQVDFDELAASGDDPVVVEAGSRAESALIVAMTSNAVPAFTWTNP